MTNTHHSLAAKNFLPWFSKSTRKRWICWATKDLPPFYYFPISSSLALSAGLFSRLLPKRESLSREVWMRLVQCFLLAKFYQQFQGNSNLPTVSLMFFTRKKAETVKERTNLIQTNSSDSSSNRASRSRHSRPHRIPLLHVFAENSCRIHQGRRWWDHVCNSSHRVCCSSWRNEGWRGEDDLEQRLCLQFPQRFCCCCFLVNAFIHFQWTGPCQPVSNVFLC